MARKAPWEELAEADLGPYAKPRGTRWGRVFTGLLVVAGATFVAAYYLPLYRAHRSLNEQYRELGQRTEQLSNSLTRTQSELKIATAERDVLRAEHEQRESAQKSDAEQRERVRAALSTKLDKVLKTGNAAIVTHANSLFVVFDSALLFVPQKLELSPAGRGLACLVAKTSEAKALVIRGSVNPELSTPAPLAASYPDPWTLSAARAAAVARVLQDTCSFPAAQLSATGNGGHDPLASELANFKPVGDRIEIELSLR